MSDGLGYGREDAALRDLAASIDWPAPVDFTTRLQLRPGERKRGYGMSWVAAAMALILVILFVPAARRAVANLLEVAGIRIEFGGETQLPPASELVVGRPVEMGVAQDAVDFAIMTPRTLEPPSSVHLLEWELGTQVFLAWAAREGLPEVGDSGTGLLLAEFRADLAEDFFSKVLLEGTTVDDVNVNGTRGFWLSGAPHEFMFETGRSDLIADATRLTGNVLIWETGGITYRLESNLSLEQSRAIAESLTAVSG
jgi:hypothetical protein